jgi:hypothetical protein
VDITQKVRVIASKVTIKVLFNLKLDEEEWLSIYKEDAELFDNKCHTLSRAYCYMNENKMEKIGARLSSLNNRHLLYKSVSCAKKVFGFEDTETTELKLGDNQFSSESNELHYFKLPSEATAAYSFTIKLDGDQSILAYDFKNCHGRSEYAEKPDLETSCSAYENIKVIYFIAFEPHSPIHLSIKFTGNVMINITPLKTIEVTAKGGSVKDEINNYQTFSYKASTPGYIVVEASTRSTDKPISLYYDTECCTKHDTIYPRLEKFCLRKTDKKQVKTVIPNHDFDRYHYFGVVVDAKKMVQFSYELFSVNEVGEGKAEFEFDNAFAMPFKYSAKKGSHTIAVTVGDEFKNMCNIYLDYHGCRTRTTLLPDVHDNCLLTNKPSHMCRLSFDLEEDTDVYFGVETIISESMIVKITRVDKKLVS